MDLTLIELVMPSLVTSIDNANVWSELSPVAIRVMVFYMDFTSALGPNSFRGKFFQHYWDIIGTDVIREIQDYFKIGQMHLRLNSNF